MVSILTSLENKNYIEKTIKRLEKQDGQILTEQDSILNEVKKIMSICLLNQQK